MRDHSVEPDAPKGKEIKRPRTAIYGRTSSREQEREQTAQIQIERATRAIEKRGYELVAKYVDEGISGELLERPALDRLLEEMEEKQIEVVLITEPDRLAREFYVQQFLQRQIKDNGARVEFLSMPPAKSEDEQLGHDLMGLVSGWERKKIKQRTLRGKLKKAKDGFVVGGKAPYGYRYIPRTRETRGCYEIIEKQARWVREIFDWCAAEGLSAEAIARRLTEEGIPTRSGGPVWRRSTVYNMLKNETYAGTAQYNKHRSIPPKNPQKRLHYRRLKNTSRELRPKEEWIAIGVPRIIDRQTWERAQEQLKRNARGSPRNTRHPYLLRGKAFCGLCDLPCYGFPSRSNLLYQCSDRYHRSPFHKICPAKSVDASTLDSLVWEGIFNALAHPHILIPQLKELQKAEADKADYHMQEHERLGRRLNKLEKAEARAAELYAYDEGMTPKQYKEQVQKIRLEKETVKREKDEQEELIGKVIDWQEAEAELNFLYADVASRLHMLSFEEKRRIVGLLVDKVTVAGNKVRIQGVIPPVRNLPTDSPSDTVAIASKSPL